MPIMAQLLPQFLPSPQEREIAQRVFVRLLSECGCRGVHVDCGGFGIRFVAYWRLANGNEFQAARIVSHLEMLSQNVNIDDYVVNWMHEQLEKGISKYEDGK